MNIKLKHEVFQKISPIVQTHEQVFVIGGYVRDYFLGRPSKDIDIVIVGNGIELAEKFAATLPQPAHVSVFKNFGTAMVNYLDTEIEFVGARRESYRSDSRKPTVENGTLEDDQNRRDFTINALAISLNPDNFGQLTDPFNGIQDLRDQLIRTPLDPDITFSDDPLRMMRGIRFATQLNFKIHPDTLASITRNAQRIEIISQERISDELNKIILSPQPSIGFKLLDKTGLLKIILPELYDLKGVDIKKGLGHKDNFLHTIKVLDNICKYTDNLWLRWAALMHDIAKAPTKRFSEESGWTFHGHEVVGVGMTKKIFTRLKLPLGEPLKYVQKMVVLHLRPIALTKEVVTDSAIRRLLFDAGNDIDDLMTLCNADMTSKNEDKIKRYRENFKLVRRKLEEIEKKDTLRNWQPPISGDLIIKTFGIKPSQEVGIIKDTIKDAILDGDIPNNYEAAFQLMLTKGKELGLTQVV